MLTKNGVDLVIILIAETIVNIFIIKSRAVIIVIIITIVSVIIKVRVVIKIKVIIITHKIRFSRPKAFFIVVIVKAVSRLGFTTSLYTITTAAVLATTESATLATESVIVVVVFTVTLVLTPQAFETTSAFESKIDSGDITEASLFNIHANFI